MRPGRVMVLGWCIYFELPSTSALSFKGICEVMALLLKVSEVLNDNADDNERAITIPRYFSK